MPNKTVLYTTMGKSLEIALRIDEILRERGDQELGSVFYASNSAYFKSLPPESVDKKVILKEWDITIPGRGREPDFDFLRRKEEELGACLWDAVLCDRRLVFGKYCKRKQDYKSRYTWRALMGIIQTGLEQVESFLDKNRPDVIFSFGVSTFGEYLFYLYSKQRKIPYYLLKSTKVENCISAFDNLEGLPSETEESYSRGQFEEELVSEVRGFLAKSAAGGVKYEGAILSSKKVRRKKVVNSPVKLARSVASTARYIADPVLRKDGHVEAPFAATLYAELVQPIKSLVLDARLSGRFLKPGDLVDRRFLFFPLHFEPEVSLQVYGKPYQNQIELIRNLALNLPAGMSVVVKEHPRSLGFRKFSYYQKLLDIPNVELVDPFCPASLIIREAEMVGVISGTIGLEGVIQKKPVITFGKVPYNVLPSSMVTHLNSLNGLHQAIVDSIRNYEYVESALHHYFCAILKTSVRVNLYTDLLKKDGRYSGEEKDEAESSEARLARFIGDRIPA